MKNKKVVYVIGAGFSAGLGFPTINNLLPRLLSRLEGSHLFDDISKIIGFHHPDFDIDDKSTFPSIELLLSEMQANEKLFRSSRVSNGRFTPDKLVEIRKNFLLELANWFHILQSEALKRKPLWLKEFVNKIKKEKAQIISFNWDLVLDELLFGEEHDRRNYGFGRFDGRVRLIKPHGSLNWYENDAGSHIKENKKYRLIGTGEKQVFAFRYYRGVYSKRRNYMPLIIPPVQIKQFQGLLFRQLWRDTVHVISEANEVNFLGFSLAQADFHARFILRCGFYNQKEGLIKKDGERDIPVGSAKVMVVDPCEDAQARIKNAINSDCEYVWHKEKIEDWIIPRKK